MEYEVKLKPDIDICLLQVVSFVLLYSRFN
jgi:hypothetical protein